MKNTTTEQKSLKNITTMDNSVFAGLSGRQQQKYL